MCNTVHRKMCNADGQEKIQDECCWGNESAEVHPNILVIWLCDIVHFKGLKLGHIRIALKLKE